MLAILSLRFNYIAFRTILEGAAAYKGSKTQTKIHEYIQNPDKVDK
jgi:hypothetical protein